MNKKCCCFASYPCWLYFIWAPETILEFPEWVLFFPSKRVHIPKTVPMVLEFVLVVDSHQNLTNHHSHWLSIACCSRFRTSSTGTDEGSGSGLATLFHDSTKKYNMKMWNELTLATMMDTPLLLRSSTSKYLAYSTFLLVMLQYCSCHASFKKFELPNYFLQQVILGLAGTSKQPCTSLSPYNKLHD